MDKTGGRIAEMAATDRGDRSGGVAAMWCLLYYKSQWNVAVGSGDNLGRTSVAVTGEISAQLVSFDGVWSDYLLECLSDSAVVCGRPGSGKWFILQSGSTGKLFVVSAVSMFVPRDGDESGVSFVVIEWVCRRVSKM